MLSNIKSLLFLFVLLWGASLFTYAQVNLSKGLVAYYPLDSNVIDHSVLALNSVRHNIIDTTGKNNIPFTAFYFNGINANIDCSDNSRGIYKTVTISAWVKTTSNKTQTIVGKYHPLLNNGFRLYIKNGKVTFAGNLSSGSYVETWGLYKKKINDGKWHHVIGQLENGVWECWVDCNLDSQKNTSITNGTLKSNESMIIGSDLRGYPFLVLNFFKGSIDEVRVYNRALNSAEKSFLCQINSTVISAPTVDNDTSICNGDSITLHATPVSGKVYWEAPKGTVVDSGNIHGTRLNQNTAFFVYSLTNGVVSDTANINVSVNKCINSYLQPILISNSLVCKDSVVNLEVKVDSGLVFWEYPKGIFTTGTILSTSFSQDTIVYVYSTSNGFFSDTLKINVKVVVCSNSFIAPVISTDTIVCMDSIFILSAIADSGLVVWESPLGTQKDTGNIYSTSINQPKTFYAYAVSSGFVSDTSSVYVDVKGCSDPIFANVFTPNGDGVNDYLRFTIPYATCFDLMIYNRWGTEVYKSNQVGFGWDGRIQSSGIPVEDGVYFYTITYCINEGEAQVKNGTITIFR